MKKFAFCAVVALGATVSGSAMAQEVFFNGPQPVQTYTVCNHDALFAANPRAVRVSSGQRSFAINGNIATISRTPDIFIQRERLVRNSYQSLSASGNCY